MNVPNRCRPYLKLLDKFGVSLEGITITGSCHYKLHVTANGNSRFFVAPFSPSDRRGIKNFESDLKRWIRQGSVH